MKADKKNIIMLVDDSSTNNLLYESIFESEGYDVIICEDGKSALKKLNSKDKPDLILLDLMMPGLDGFSVLEKIYSNPENKNIPIIMLTAKVDIESEKKAYKLGVTDYIIKPIGINEITEEIKLILEGKFIPKGK
jgi:putative two-component system response regulator